MERVNIVRKPSDEKQTLGKLFVDSWGVHTLELAWKGNQNNISCIPVGEYECIWTRSNRLSALHGSDFFTYEVVGVPNRSGIRIHSANFFHQLLGCIALGLDEGDINSDNELDMINSRMAVRLFNERMNKEPFLLIISDESSEVSA